LSQNDHGKRNTGGGALDDDDDDDDEEEEEAVCCFLGFFLCRCFFLTSPPLLLLLLFDDALKKCDVAVLPIERLGETANASQKPLNDVDATYDMITRVAARHRAKTWRPIIIGRR
jgi:hypothetical protein